MGHHYYSSSTAAADDDDIFEEFVVRGGVAVEMGWPIAARSAWRPYYT